MAHRMHDGAVNAAHRMHLHPHSPKAKQPVDDSKKHPGQLYDEKLARHLGRRVEDLHEWMSEHHRIVKDRLEMLSWQSWGTDNQIIASVQTLMNECHVEMGRPGLPIWVEKGVKARAMGKSVGDDEKSRKKSKRKSKRKTLAGAVEEKEEKLLLLSAGEEGGSHVRTGTRTRARTRARARTRTRTRTPNANPEREPEPDPEPEPEPDLDP